MSGLPGPVSKMMAKTDKYKTYSKWKDLNSFFSLLWQVDIAMLSRVLATPCGLRPPTDSRARGLPAANFTLLHIICLASMVGRRHTRSVGADPEYHTTLGSCVGKMLCYWRQLLLLGPSRWAASIRIDSLNVFLSTVGMSLKRNPHSCGIGKYELEQLVGLLSRLLCLASIFAPRLYWHLQLSFDVAGWSAARCRLWLGWRERHPAGP
jgi:hypothetical protein